MRSVLASRSARTLASVDAIGVKTEVNLACCAAGIATLGPAFGTIMVVCAIRHLGRPVLHFNVGEVIETERSLSDTTRQRGHPRVTANGYVVTVQWYQWLRLRRPREYTPF